MIPNVNEKRKPHYVLSEFKTLFRNENSRLITQKARQGAVAEGYMTVEDVQSIIDRLCSEHFYKSMTTYANHKVWQDVYKFTDEEKKLYIKLQFSVDKKKAILIQMKKDKGNDD